MSSFLPPGYISIREAAAVVERAMTFGLPDNPMVIKLRNQGFDVGDHDARNDALAKIWAGVAKRKVPMYGIHPQARSPLRIPADIVAGIPALTTTRIASLHYLRHGNPLYARLASRFNVPPNEIELAIRVIDIQTFSKSIVRSRHRSKVAKTGTKSRGRPEKRPDITEVIKRIVDQKRWSTLNGIKALTHLVNRSTRSVAVSTDTVSRELHAIFVDTKDRRFERVKRTGKLGCGLA